MTTLEHRRLFPTVVVRQMCILPQLSNRLDNNSSVAKKKPTLETWLPFSACLFPLFSSDVCFFVHKSFWLALLQNLANSYINVIIT